jgi:hypothetical protein
MPLGDWTLTVTGTVLRIDRENIDKTARNPKFMLSIVVDIEQIDAPAEAILPAELAVRIADRELPRLGGEPQVGERVTMRARASGNAPSTFYLTELTRA